VLIASGPRNKFVFSPPNQCRDGYAVVCTLGVGDTSGSRVKRPEWLPFIAPLRPGEQTVTRSAKSAKRSRGSACQETFVAFFAGRPLRYAGKARCRPPWIEQTA
jgi:hypothetical protein